MYAIIFIILKWISQVPITIPIESLSLPYMNVFWMYGGIHSGIFVNAKGKNMNYNLFLKIMVM